MTENSVPASSRWDDTFEERRAWIANYWKEKNDAAKAGRRDMAVWYAARWIHSVDARRRSRNPMTPVEIHDGALDAMLHAASERIWRRFRRDRPVTHYRAMLVEELASYSPSAAHLTTDPTTWPGYSTSQAVRNLHSAFVANSMRSQEIRARFGNLDDPPKPRLTLTLKTARKN